MVRLEELKIGQQVRDNATKAEGVITARCDHLAGYTQLVVQLKEADGKVPEAYALDWQSFVILNDDLVANTIQPEKHPFTLGDKVEAVDIGVKGVIARFWTYVNGCVFAALTIPLNKHNEPQDAVQVPVSRLRIIKAAQPIKQRRTAGPPTRCGG